MTESQLRGLEPGDKVHRQLRPSGCAEWAVATTGDTAVGYTVTTRAKWPGGGSPALSTSRPAELEQFHLAGECPAAVTARAS